ncbi:MAG TPA: DinB family protein [Thermoanaerobaculia bacterium]|nr:DinB family protein [Thermoanaerobaculia bacterium]
MRRVERMLLELNASYDGSPWHGTSLLQIIGGLSEEKALAHPGPGKRSIAEIVAHIMATMDIVQRRLTAESFEVTTEMDSPSISNVTWNDLLTRIQQSQTRLVDSVARMKDADFDQNPPGKNYSVDFMLYGLLQHTAYHAGQIAMMKS